MQNAIYCQGGYKWNQLVGQQKLMGWREFECLPLMICFLDEIVILYFDSACQSQTNKVKVSQAMILTTQLLEVKVTSKNKGRTHES